MALSTPFVAPGRLCCLVILSSISLIARHAEKRGQRMSDLGIRVAFVTSERLYDHQRDDITRVFGCPVANGYGGRDAGFIAHQCPQGSMHLTAEDIIVELVDQEGNAVPHGTAGEVVVTIWPPVSSPSFATAPATLPFSPKRYAPAVEDCQSCKKFRDEPPISLSLPMAQSCTD